MAIRFRKSQWLYCGHRTVKSTTCVQVGVCGGGVKWEVDELVLMPFVVFKKKYRFAFHLQS